MSAPNDPFLGWLREQTERDDAIGDIARDVVQDIRDGCMSERLKPTRVTYHIINEHGASQEVVGALSRAMSEWLAWAPA